MCVHDGQLALLGHALDLCKHLCLIRVYLHDGQLALLGHALDLCTHRVAALRLIS